MNNTSPLVSRKVYIQTLSIHRNQYFLSNTGDKLLYSSTLDNRLQIFTATLDKQFSDGQLVSFSNSHLNIYIAGYEPAIWFNLDNGLVLSTFENGGHARYYYDLTTDTSTPLHPIQFSYSYIAYERHSGKKSYIAVTRSDRDAKYKDFEVIDLNAKQSIAYYENKWGWDGLLMDEQLRPRYVDLFEADGRLSLYTFTPITKPTQAIYQFEPEDSYVSRILELSNDAQTLICRSSRGRDTGALVKINLRTQQETVLFEDEQFDVGLCHFHPQTREPMACTIIRESSELIPLTADFKYLQNTLEDKLTSRFSLVNYNHDFNATIVSDTKGQMWYTQTDAVQPILLSKEANNEAYRQRAEVESFYVKTEDGFQLLCYLTYAPKQKDEATPLIVLPHGGPWLRDTDEWNGTAQWLCNRGYKVLQVNFRGSRGFGKRFFNADALEWGGKLIDDVAIATRYVMDHYFILRDKVGLMGRSFGGYVTLMGLIRYPELYCCGCGGDMPTDLMDMFDIPYWKSELPVVYRHVGNPHHAKEQAIIQKYSPHYYAHALKQPLLYNMGEHQPNNVLSKVRDTMGIIDAHNSAFSYVCLKGEGHGQLNSGNLMYLMYLQEKFFALHLGGDFEPWDETVPRPELHDRVGLNLLD